MTRRLTVLERAFEIAKGGSCSGWREVAKRLKSEGHERVTVHFDSVALRKQISALCVLAQARTMGAAMPADDRTHQSPDAPAL